MTSPVPPLVPGKVSTYAALAGDVGKRYNIDGIEYVLVDITGSITVVGGDFLEWADPALGTVNGLADAAETISNVAGMVPIGVTDTSLADGDYLLLARRGCVEAKTAAATAAGAALAIHGAAGLLDDTTVTANTTVAYGFDAAGAAATITVFLALP